MKKTLLHITVIFCFFLTHLLFAQKKYTQNWGALYTSKEITYYDTVLKQTDTARYRNNEMITAIDKNNKLYLIHEETNSKSPDYRKKRLYEFNENSNLYKVTNLDQFLLIFNLKIDNNNQIVIHGLANNKIALHKIDLNGKIVEEFNISPQANKDSYAFDSQNNIYALEKIDKSIVLSPSYFQNTGDQNSTIIKQDVISKYDSKGKKLWSTFYFNNQSYIWGIAVGTNGVYAYGHEFLTTSTSSYFGTQNSHQPNASGIIKYGDPNSGKNTFLAKFNTDGTRAWSTYYGTQLSNVPLQETTLVNKTLEVDGDDVYILTYQYLPKGINNQPHTTDAAIKTRPDITEAKTLSKFDGTGKKLWTSYTYDAEMIHKNIDKNITLSGTNNLITNLPTGTSDAFQQNLSGPTDHITYIISADGKQIKYLSFFGYQAKESGIAIPSQNGYFVIGSTGENNSKYTQIPTANSKLNLLEKHSYLNNSHIYLGNFVSFFSNKTVAIEDHNKNTLTTNNFKIYPNPVSDILTIESEQELLENTNFIIYDLNGRMLFEQKMTDIHKNNISVGHLPTNVYLLQIQNSNVNQTIKFIKK